MMRMCHLLVDMVLAGGVRPVVIAFDEAGTLCQGREGQMCLWFLCLLEALSVLEDKVRRSYC